MATPFKRGCGRIVSGMHLYEPTIGRYPSDCKLVFWQAELSLNKEMENEESIEEDVSCVVARRRKELGVVDLGGGRRSK